MTGTVELPRGHRDGDAGRRGVAGIKLIAPIAMDVGQRFTIREGGRTVGAGVVSSIEK